MDKEFNYLKIDGLIEVSENPIEALEFSDKFIEFIESNNWYFGGGIGIYTKEDEERDIEEFAKRYENKHVRGRRHRCNKGKEIKLRGKRNV